MPKKYDFSGWATRSNIKCSDGRIIANNAFKDNDGQIVPLVWSHEHNDPASVLGHALLENRGDGVYAYCSFNDSENGQNAKKIVEHRDVAALSIYANQLEQDGHVVSHGNIREVSLVLAGANPGAYIENIMSHSGLEIEEEAIIHNDGGIDPEPGEIEDAQNDDNQVGDQDTQEETQDEQEEKEEIKEEPAQNEEQQEEDDMSEEIKHADDGQGADNSTDNQNTAPKSEKTVQEVFDSMTDEQKNVVYFLVGQAVEDATGGNSEGGQEMKQDVFEGDNYAANNTVLSHDELKVIFDDAKSCGSLRDSVMAHSAEYGIENIEWLFPEHKNLKNVPDFIRKTPSAWVEKVMNGVSKSPFSRIRMVFADITADQARAKGYTKGNRKIEEVFGLLRRKVGPTTIYKKQKLDRDDIVDITDFDVVSWMKTEMRMMLDEEIARAAMFGDGRSTLEEDKIKEDCVIPAISDDPLYTITHVVEVPEGMTEEEALLDAAILGAVNYQGSGNLTAFMRRITLSKSLLLKDGFKHRLYKDASEVALAMNVKSIEEVPVDVMPEDVLALLIDLSDYTIGADKGGAINMFDDFDIDYNQEKYLIETRCSGALTKPYSAIVLKKSSTPVDPSQS